MLRAISSGVTSATPCQRALSTFFQNRHVPLPKLSLTLSHERTVQRRVAKPNTSHMSVNGADGDPQTRCDIRVRDRILGKTDQTKSDPRLSRRQLRTDVLPQHVEVRWLEEEGCKPVSAAQRGLIPSV